MLKFETATGSLYEVDTNNQKIRRLVGIKNPSPYQGKDGHWKYYIDMEDPEVGKSVWILWGLAKGDNPVNSFTGKVTITSPVKKIWNQDEQNN